MQKTIKENVSAEIVEKKSKFIANLFYVQNEEEAEEIIKKIKKKYYDARHNCYAYNIMTKDGIIAKSSDDGEPSGTAGAPMLNIIQKNDLINVLVIVTRYFGGILLGTGGLVRAYSEALTNAIEKAKFVSEELGYEVQVIIEYGEQEKLEYYCRQNKLNIVDVQYTDKINCIIEMNNKEKEDFINNLNKMNYKIEKYEVLKEKNIRKNIEI
ncbi:MAG: YigZ family protein [Clostridia bacterium]|nr:YigZ family protein [Clostridia bacterium]